MLIFTIMQHAAPPPSPAANYEGGFCAAEDLVANLPKVSTSTRYNRRLDTVHKVVLVVKRPGATILHHSAQ